MGQLQNQPGLTDILHPGTDERYALAEPEQPEVSVVKRRKTGTDGFYCNSAAHSKPSFP
jgi:hypothetical protein